MRFKYTICRPRHAPEGDLSTALCAKTGQMQTGFPCFWGEASGNVRGEVRCAVEVGVSSEGVSMLPMSDQTG
jgi:hypothetical protein